MKRCILFSLIFFLCLNLFAQKKIRQPVDTVGFATKAWQMDAVIKRIQKLNDVYFEMTMTQGEITDSTCYRLAICPHDDYTYAGLEYECVIPHIKAKTVIIFGVAHKAKKFGVESKIVFDSFDEWKEPYGNIQASALRSEIIEKLPTDCYIVNDSLQQAEHSVEAIIPFLQYHNSNVQFIPILIPYMSFEKMEKYSVLLSKAIGEVMTEQKLVWGKDIAIVISNDAVHYGDEDWGGKNYADYGCDTAGYNKAVNHESEIIKCLLPVPGKEKVNEFFKYTVQSEDWHEYKWPWCGRYSVPFGILTAVSLAEITKGENLLGVRMDYSTSISNKPLPVEDLQMGKTAIATLHHWVGYAAIGYK
jgi:MEMO1 family protein